LILSTFCSLQCFLSLVCIFHFFQSSSCLFVA
jgi:hypothetical protein